MRQKSYISNVIESDGNKVKYDGEVKKVISDKVILAWIMKYSVEEFKDYPIEVIQDCIEGKPEVGSVKVRPGRKPEAITGLSTENKVPGEGTVTFDIRFYAITPDKKHIKLIINVEAQKNFRPGYDLVTRGVFYCARMLSAQLDTEFTTNNYDDIKKVYSIWICMDVPKYAENTITEYKIEQNKIFGDFRGEARYDLMSVVMICLGKNNRSAQGSQLHRLLAALLSESLTVVEKEKILHEEYGIAASVETKEALNIMCNLSDRIEEKGIEKGIEQGIKVLVETCQEFGISQGETISRVEQRFSISGERVREYIQKYWK